MSHRSILTVLSPDLLLHILDRIPSSDRKPWRLVCKDFLAIEHLQRKNLIVLRHEFLLPLLRRYTSLETLDLSKCPRVDDRTLLEVFGRVRNQRIRSVDLRKSTAVRWWGLEVLVGSCSALAAVDLSHCSGVGDREMAAIARAKGLRELRVEKCVGISDVGLAMVAVGCGGLERLCLKWCVEISDIGIDLLVKKCRGLKELDVSYLKVTNASLLSSSTLEKLEVLFMAGCAYVDDDGLAYLNNGMSSLKSIDVSRCVNVSSLGLTSIIRGHGSLEKIDAGYCMPEISASFVLKLEGLAHLKTIKLDLFKISAPILQSIGLYCKTLLEISLSKCAGVTDDGIFELVSGCCNLRSLDLTCCHLITDNALSAIGRSCQKLMCLKLESCTLITIKGLECIGSCCTNLQEIDLTDCCINDKALEYLSKCLELIELKVALCPDITDKGLSHIGSNCRKLQALDLYRCNGIGDDGLICIASGCKNLKKLNICYCTRMSDQGLKHLCELQELSELEMRGLHSITSAGVKALAVGCKSLVELDLKHCHAIDDLGIWALARYTENLRQINVSYCSITDTGLRVLLGKMRCLQDAKLIHLSWASAEGFEHALRSSRGRLKKVKLLSSLRNLISPITIQTLEAHGCRVRWTDKPLVME